LRKIAQGLAFNRNPFLDQKIPDRQPPHLQRHVFPDAQLRDHPAGFLPVVCHDSDAGAIWVHPTLLAGGPGFLTPDQDLCR
jgi:hypothetical protein